MNSYHNKYVKYKTKYLKLKGLNLIEQIGGTCNKTEIQINKFKDLLKNKDCNYDKLKDNINFKTVKFNYTHEGLRELLSKDFPIDFLIDNGYDLSLFKQVIVILREEEKSSKIINGILKNLKKKVNNYEEFLEAGFILKDFLIMGFNVKEHNFTIQDLINDYYYIYDDINDNYLSEAGFNKEEIKYFNEQTKHLGSKCPPKSFPTFINSPYKVLRDYDCTYNEILQKKKKLLEKFNYNNYFSLHL